MEKLDKYSMVFMADLLNCMIDDVNVTLIIADDPELINMLDCVNNKLRSAYQRLNNFNVRRKYYE